MSSPQRRSASSASASQATPQVVPPSGIRTADRLSPGGGRAVRRRRRGAKGRSLVEGPCFPPFLAESSSASSSSRRRALSSSRPIASSSSPSQRRSASGVGRRRAVGGRVARVVFGGTGVETDKFSGGEEGRASGGQLQPQGGVVRVVPREVEHRRGKVAPQDASRARVAAAAPAVSEEADSKRFENRGRSPSSGNRSVKADRTGKLGLLGTVWDSPTSKHPAWHSSAASAQRSTPA